MYTLLSINDFKVEPLPDKSGQFLRLNSGRLTLVLFYAPRCSHSKRVLPHLELLATQPQFSDFEFAVYNVSAEENKSIIESSKYTIQPIKYVPLLIIYKNHCPLMTYDGPLEPEAIAKFLIDAPSSIPETVGTQPVKTPPSAVQPKPSTGRKFDKYRSYSTAYNA